MSYILDALKKSEREKTLGQVPTLETVVADGAKKQTNGTPWWLNLLVFVLVLLVVLAGLYFAGLIKFDTNKNTLTVGSQTVNQNSANQAEVAAEPAQVTTTEAIQQNIGQAEQQQTELPVQQTINTTETQQLEAQAQPIDSQPVAGPQTNITQKAIEEIEQAVIADQTTEIEEIAAAQQQALIQQQASESAAVEQLQQSPQVIVQEPVETAGSEASATQQIAATPAANNDYEEVLHQNLRNVAVNVVSYSSDARQRFVMLDLTIYKEGDSLSNGAEIVEIMRGGAIVNFQNKRYLLKP